MCTHVVVYCSLGQALCMFGVDGVGPHPPKTHREPVPGYVYWDYLPRSHISYLLVFWLWIVDKISLPRPTTIRQTVISSLRLKLWSKCWSSRIKNQIHTSLSFLFRAVQRKGLSLQLSDFFQYLLNGGDEGCSYSPLYYFKTIQLYL